MRGEKEYIPGIFAAALKRKEVCSEKDRLSKEIAGKLGTLITEHGGWNNEKREVVYIGSFPMFDSEKGHVTDPFYDVEVNFVVTNKDNSLPNGITVKVHKDRERGVRDLFSVSFTYSEGSQLFKINDGLGREISKIKDLEKLNKLVDRICAYGNKHLPHPEKT